LFLKPSMTRGEASGNECINKISGKRDLIMKTIMDHSHSYSVKEFSAGSNGRLFTMEYTVYDAVYDNFVYLVATMNLCSPCIELTGEILRKLLKFANDNERRSFAEKMHKVIS